MADRIAELESWAEKLGPVNPEMERKVRSIMAEMEEATAPVIVQPRAAAEPRPSQAVVCKSKGCFAPAKYRIRADDDGGLFFYGKNPEPWAWVELEVCEKHAEGGKASVNNLRNVRVIVL